MNRRLCDFDIGSENFDLLVFTSLGLRAQTTSIKSGHPSYNITSMNETHKLLIIID